MVAMELSGVDVRPQPADILRTAGSPDASGVCTLDNGQMIVAL